MTQTFRACGNDASRLDQSELDQFNAYYARHMRVGSSPLTLEEAELVLRLMTAEQRWGVRIALQKARKLQTIERH